MKKLIVYLLLAAGVGQIYAVKNAKVTNSPVAQAVNTYNTAVQKLGDIFIKNNLFQPWLGQMRDLQTQLDQLDVKNNLQLKQKAIQTIEAHQRRCQEFMASQKNPTNPADIKLQQLSEQKKQLIKSIINKKETDVNALIAVNEQLDQEMKKLFAKAMQESSKETNMMGGTDQNLPADYNQVLNQLKAYSEVVFFALDALELPETQKVLQSAEVQKYAALLKKNYRKSEKCELDVSDYTREANDLYASTIASIMGWYDIGQMMQKKSTAEPKQ